jgi:2-keto-4-pentenoate hydratase/2-oxohepta-3-ene-1,7-dioic acid hydratase in catechol pathway
MRFVSFLVDGRAAWGVQRGDGVVPGPALGLSVAADLPAFIAQCDATPGLLADVARRAAAATSLAAVELLPCVPQPGKIVCLGVKLHRPRQGGRQHGGRLPGAVPALQQFAAGPRRATARAGGQQQVDYEAELAVVIGRRARFIAESDALAHVFGYACFNDATLRDYQRKTTQWTIGKNFDATGGFGPALVTADEPPPGCVGLHIESRLNGQVMQSASTADMIFGVARTIALLSECMTLEPGDLIVMGTPSGVGCARTPPVWMKAGDTIEIEIEGVGLLSNPVL